MLDHYESRGMHIDSNMSYQSVSERHVWLLTSCISTHTVNPSIPPTIDRRISFSALTISLCFTLLYHCFFFSYLAEVEKRFPLYIALGLIIALLSLLLTYILRRGWCVNSDGRLRCKSRAPVNSASVMLRCTALLFLDVCLLHC